MCIVKSLFKILKLTLLILLCGGVLSLFISYPTLKYRKQQEEYRIQTAMKLNDISKKPTKERESNVAIEKPIPNTEVFLNLSKFFKSGQSSLLQTSWKTVKPTVVILVSSLPRSGSSILAQILRTRNSSVLFYEPIRPIRFASCVTKEHCIASYLQIILSCNFNEDFVNFQRNFGFKYFHDYQNCKNDIDCIKSVDMRKMCSEANFKMTKVIRAPVSSVRFLLRDYSPINTKIIHLIRDPRASIASIMRIKSWESDPAIKCTKYLSDIIAYDKLKEEYPSLVMQIKYEQLSLDPVGEIKSMFNFAFGDQELSRLTLTAVNSFTNNFNAAQKAQQHYDMWRWEISEEAFLKIESEKSCRKSLKRMNFRIFNTTQNLRDKNLSVFS